MFRKISLYVLLLLFLVGCQEEYPTVTYISHFYYEDPPYTVPDNLEAFYPLDLYTIDSVLLEVDELIVEFSGTNQLALYEKERQRIVRWFNHFKKGVLINLKAEEVRKFDLVISIEGYTPDVNYSENTKRRVKTVEHIVREITGTTPSGLPIYHLSTNILEGETPSRVRLLFNRLHFRRTEWR